MRDFLPSSIGSYFDFVDHIFYNQVFSDENFKNIKLNQLGKKGVRFFYLNYCIALNFYVHWHVEVPKGIN